MLAASVWTCAAGAAATVGFIEDWPGISLSGWAGATAVAHPGSGGAGGAGDGFLRLSSALPAQFGTFSTDLEDTDDWQAFDVDLSSASFTQCFGTGTLAAALTNVRKIHFRHDLAPFTQFPDPVAGDVGLDLAPGVCRVRAWGPSGGTSRPLIRVR